MATQKLGLAPVELPPFESLFDFSEYQTVIQCPAIIVPRQSTQIIHDHFLSRLFKRDDVERIKTLIKYDEGRDRFSLFILQDYITEESFTDEDREILSKTGAKIGKKDVVVFFENRPTDWIFKKRLPHIPNVISHFEIIGHIAHLNLRGEDMLKAKYIIGSVILHKHKHEGIRTVINKTDSIENEFRVLPMELIAGDHDTMVKVPESGVVFEFDFSEVFWNSRLIGEHARIVQLCKPGQDIVCDMFAGIGPFAIPLANRGVQVHANDLNPHSYKWMVKNAEKNLGKKKRPNITCYNLDGREFVRKLFQEQKVPATQILMNLPASAPEFCDVFINLVPKGMPLPRAHVYCFSNAEKEEDLAPKAISRIEGVLGCKLGSDVQILKIRQTAVNTVEFVISFILPAEICYMKE